jgi:phosphoribosyl 1,2-cyclic phosphate phosphodiesterase
MTMRVTLLGTGTSTGVPIIGCDCKVCTSHDPRDRRDRPGAMVQWTDGDIERTVLIDTSTDLRWQMIRHDVQRIDGIVYTHNHADHVFGLDDVRRFNAVQKEAIDVFGERRVLDWLRRTFAYVFDPSENVNQSFVASLDLHEVAAGEPTVIAGREFRPIRLLHGKLPILGWRVGDVAYCTDCSEIPDESMDELAGLEVLVIDALRHRPHPTHLTIEQALAVVDRLKPRRTYFTHIAHDILHAELESQLPEHVILGHDGLTFEVPGV